MSTTPVQVHDRVTDLSRAIAARVKKMRNERGWSQSQLAEMCGVASVTITVLERGQRNLTMSLLERLAASFGVPPWRLLYTHVPSCSHCHNTPDPGYTCNTCGRTGLAFTGGV